MITLVIKNGRVLDYGPPQGNWARYDETFEIVDWDGDTAFLNAKAPFDPEEHPMGLPTVPPLDPRTEQQKLADAQNQYKRHRRHAHPRVHAALMMIYRDMKKGTTEYVDAVDRINVNHPKP